MFELLMKMLELTDIDKDEHIDTMRGKYELKLNLKEAFKEYKRYKV